LIHPRLTFVALASALFFVSENASAEGRFRPGDRIECDWLQNGTYEKGVIVPFERNDLDQSGRWYRVKLDKDSIPNSTVECMANRLREPREARTRPAEGPAPTGPASRPLEPGKPPTTRFKPGDRVECDKAQIGVWEKGTVVPFLPTDRDISSGRYYRVKLDGYTLYPAGHECMAHFVRPVAGRGPNITGGDGVQGPRDAERRSPPDSVGPAPRVLPGTAWKIDFGRGPTGAVFLFCRTGTWQNVLAGGRIGAVGRSYSVSGTTLTTVNADDGMTRRWRMTWQGDVLEIFDGKEALKLHYNGETQCK
jgi:hypothetical protein